jgi:hypothetical protein
MQVAEVIKGNSEYLAEWVTREQGKPLGGVGPDQVPGSRFELWGSRGLDSLESLTSCLLDCMSSNRGPEGLPSVWARGFTK